MDIQKKYINTAHYIINRYRNILTTKKIGFKLLEGREYLNSLLCELALFHLEDMHYPQATKRIIRTEIYKILNIPEPVEQ
jgi:hypothetical protein